MNRFAPWERYLFRLCLDRWSLDPASTIRIMMHIDSLIAPGAASDSSVATVLQRAGVTQDEACRVAPSIRTAMIAQRDETAA
jgi:hypothetical protein